VLELSPAQNLKLHILARGLSISVKARRYLMDNNGNTKTFIMDYATTSGLILKLADDVWVNAPVHDHNAFAAHATSVLDLQGDSLVVHDGTLESPAWYCLLPKYHEEAMDNEFRELIITHGDRVRLSPMRSCSMTCKFCNVPYEDPISTYELKPIDACLKALRIAIDDPVQPAHHILISGGTPKPRDVDNHRELYQRVIATFPGTPVDIMMVPIPGILDIPALKDAGLNDLSINLEMYDSTRQQALARQKYNWGRNFYLDFIETAADVLGPGHVRSMLLVGLEDTASTLAGVQAIAQRGGVPVLSPFRPDPATPMRNVQPADFTMLCEVYQRSLDIATKYGTFLGPRCPPCSHNTLSFGMDADGTLAYRYEHPAML